MDSDLAASKKRRRKPKKRSGGEEGPVPVGADYSFDPKLEADVLRAASYEKLDVSQAEVAMVLLEMFEANGDYHNVSSVLKEIKARRAEEAGEAVVETKTAEDAVEATPEPVPASLPEEAAVVEAAEPEEVAEDEDEEESSEEVQRRLEMVSALPDADRVIASLIQWRVQAPTEHEGLLLSSNALVNVIAGVIARRDASAVERGLTNLIAASTTHGPVTASGVSVDRSSSSRLGAASPTSIAPRVVEAIVAAAASLEALAVASADIEGADLSALDKAARIAAAGIVGGLRAHALHTKGMASVTTDLAKLREHAEALEAEAVKESKNPLEALFLGRVHSQRVAREWMDAAEAVAQVQHLTEAPAEAGRSSEEIAAALSTVLDAVASSSDDGTDTGAVKLEMEKTAQEIRAALAPVDSALSKATEELRALREKRAALLAELASVEEGIAAATRRRNAAQEEKDHIGESFRHKALALGQQRKHFLLRSKVTDAEGALRALAVDTTQELDKYVRTAAAARASDVKSQSESLSERCCATGAAYMEREASLVGALEKRVATDEASVKAQEHELARFRAFGDSMQAVVQSTVSRIARVKEGIVADHAALAGLRADATAFCASMSSNIPAALLKAHQEHVKRVCEAALGAGVEAAVVKSLATKAGIDASSLVPKVPSPAKPEARPTSEAPSKPAPMASKASVPSKAKAAAPSKPRPAGNPWGSSGSSSHTVNLSQVIAEQSAVPAAPAGEASPSEASPDEAAVVEASEE
jgi:hypothetical protein